MTDAGPGVPPGGDEAVRAAVEGHLWQVAIGVWHPSVALKDLGLYHPEQAGARPPPPSGAGRGAHFSRLHPGPVLLDEDVAGPGRSPAPADRTGCVLATHARVVFDELLRVVAPYLTPSSRLLHGGGGQAEVLDLAVAVPDGEVVALDRSAAAVAELLTMAREAGIGNLAVFQGDLGSLPGALAGQFDAVLLWFAYHHRPDPGLVAAELRRALRPGGYALLVDPAQTRTTEPDWFAALADVDAHAFHGPTELARWFDAAGFPIFHWEELLPGVGLVIAMA
jgi:SAM-dependent methyltransferase